MAELITPIQGNSTFQDPILRFLDHVEPGSRIGSWLQANALERDPSRWSQGVLVAQSSLCRREAYPMTMIIRDTAAGLLVRVGHRFAVGQRIDRDTVVLYPWILAQINCVTTQDHNDYLVTLLPETVPPSLELQDLLSSLSNQFEFPPEHIQDIIFDALDAEISEAISLIKAAKPGSTPPALMTWSRDSVEKLTDLLDGFTFWLSHIHSGNFAIEDCRLDPIGLAQSTPKPRIKVHCRLGQTTSRRGFSTLSKASKSAQTRLISTITHLIRNSPERLGIVPMTTQHIESSSPSSVYSRCLLKNAAQQEPSSHLKLMALEIFGDKKLATLS